HAIPIPNIGRYVASAPVAFYVHVIVAIGRPTFALEGAVNFTEPRRAIVEPIVVSGHETASIALFVQAFFAHVALVAVVVILDFRLELVVMIAIVDSLVQSVAISVL